MYNVNGPMGLRPVRMLSGAPYVENLNSYPIASGYATSIFTGDPVIMLSDGTIGIGVAGSPSLGVFWGCKYQLSAPQANGNKFIHSPYWPASTTVPSGTVVEAMIIDDPFVVFDIQETAADGTAGTALALADRNLNANFVIGSGNTATGQSTTSLNNASENTTITLNLKILGLTPRVDNAVGSYANWLVAWNNHLFKSQGTTGL